MSRLVLQAPTDGPKAPSPDEMAAIVVAVEELWPKPSIEDDVANTAETVWKFANRWWQGSSVSQRRRPSRTTSFG